MVPVSQLMRPGAAARLPGTPQVVWEAAVRQVAREVGAQAWAVREVGGPALPMRLPVGIPPPSTFQQTPIFRPSWMRLSFGRPRLSRIARRPPLAVGRKVTGTIAQTKTACSRVATRVDRQMLALRFFSAEPFVGLEAWRCTHPSR